MLILAGPPHSDIVYHTVQQHESCSCPGLSQHCTYELAFLQVSVQSLQRAAGLQLVAHLKEVSSCLRPDSLMHVHFATTFPDDTHDPGVRDGTLDIQRLMV